MPREDAVSMLSCVPVAADLSIELVYNNLVYEVLGQVIEHVSDTDFCSFLSTRFPKVFRVHQHILHRPVRGLSECCEDVHCAT